MFVFMGVVMKRYKYKQMSLSDSKAGNKKILNGCEKFSTYIVIGSLGVATIFGRTSSYDING